MADNPYLKLYKEQQPGSTERQDPQSSNPYLEIYSNKERQRQATEELMLSEAVKVQPEQAAQAYEFSKKENVPYIASKNSLRELRERAAARDLKKIARGNPILQKFYSNPINAEIAHDDGENLAGVAHIADQVFKNFGMALGITDAKAEPKKPEPQFYDGIELGEMRSADPGTFESMGRALERGFLNSEKYFALMLREFGLVGDDGINFAARMADKERQIQGLPMSQESQQATARLSQAKTFTEAATILAENPQATGELILESLAATVPGMATTIAGGTLGGPGGSAAGAAMGSFAIEYSATISQAVAEAGLDPLSAEDYYQVLNDADLMAQAREKAVKRGIPIAAFDALTAGLAGKFMAGAKPTFASTASRTGAEVGLQAGGGAAGEAVAGAVTGEFSPGDILLEALAEIPTAIPEVMTNYGSYKVDAGALNIPPETRKAIIETLMQNPDGGFDAVFDELTASGMVDAETGNVILDDGSQGPALSAAARTLGKAIRAGRQAEINKQVSETRVEAFKELQQAVTSTSTFQRSKAAFENFAQTALESNPDAVIYVDLEGATEYFQGTGADPEQVFEDMGAGTAYRLARETGTDVRVPLTKFMAAADSEHYEPLLQDIRMNQADDTMRESARKADKEIDDLVAEASDILESDETATEFKQSADGVYDTVLQGLLNTGLPRRQAEGAAAMHRAFASVMAQDTGRLPLDVYQERELAFRNAAGEAPAGSTIMDQPGTTAFDNWFQNSVVVDENGNPLIVYHGTTQDFTTFERPEGAAMGYHFGTSQAAADIYGDEIPENARTIPVYLSIKNPLVVPFDTGFYDADITLQYLRDFNPDGIGEEAGRLREEQPDMDIEELQQWLESLGYDGIQYTNTGEDNGSVSWIAFNQSQIKSAVGNSGAYDPNNPNIMFQRGAVEQVVPEPGTDTVNLPYGRVENEFRDLIERLKGDRDLLTTRRLAKVFGAPKKRKGKEKLDKAVRPTSYTELKEMLDWALQNDAEGDWYVKFGRGFADLVGEANMHEASIIFGVTSAQNSAEANFADTLHIMSLARKHNPVENERAFKNAVKNTPRPDGQRLKITGAQINTITDMYQSGLYEGGLKVSSYMQLIRAVGKNEFVPWSVQDVHMARVFGFRYKDIDKKTGQVVDAAKFPSAAAIRYGMMLTTELAKEYQLTPDQVQAYLWFFAKSNLSPKKETKGGAGTFDSAFKYALPEMAVIRDMIRNGEFDKDNPITPAMDTATPPAFRSPVVSDPYTNVDLLDELTARAEAEGPRVLVSAKPGNARGYGFPEGTDVRSLLRYHRRVLREITDEQGRIKFLVEAGIPHQVRSTFGTWEGLEPTFEIVLPGETMKTARMVAAIMGDALLQDAAIPMQPAWGGQHYGITVKKADGTEFTQDEMSAILDKINPGNTTEGLNFSATGDATGLKFLDDTFWEADNYGNAQLDAFAAKIKEAFGDGYTFETFTQQSDFIDLTREGGEDRVKIWDDNGLAGRPDLQRAAVNTLYKPIWSVYKHTHDWVLGAGPVNESRSPLGLLRRSGQTGYGRDLQSDARWNARAGLPIRQDGVVPLTHWGKKEGLIELDPNYHGKGAAGAESSRATSDHWVNRTYYGLPGYQVEPGVAALAKARYTAEIHPGELYDIAGDPLGFREQARAEGINTPTTLGNRTEQLIKEAGYKGYWVKEPIMSVALFDRTPVEQAPLRDDNGQLVETAGANKEGALTLYQSAYHGTGNPDPYEGFDTAHVNKGRGQGAQAFGWGLYFTTKRSIANWYKRTYQEGIKRELVYTGDQTPFPEGDKRNDFFAQYVAELISDGGALDAAGINAAALRHWVRIKKSNIEEANSGYEQRVSDGTMNEGEAKIIYQALEAKRMRIEALDRIRPEDLEVKETGSRGKLYKVELAPEEKEYLRWDKTLSETPYVMEILQRRGQRNGQVLKSILDVINSALPPGMDYSPQEWRNVEGGSLYRMLEQAVGSGRDFYRDDKSIWGHTFTKTTRPGVTYVIHQLVNDRTGEVVGEGSMRAEAVTDAIQKENLRADMVASLLLHSAGVRGVKFPAAAMGGARGGNVRNVVVVDGVEYDPDNNKLPRELNDQEAYALDVYLQNNGNLEDAVASVQINIDNETNLLAQIIDGLPAGEDPNEYDSVLRSRNRMAAYQERIDYLESLRGSDIRIEERGDFNYVMFEGSDVQILEYWQRIMEQTKDKGPRGSITFPAGGMTHGETILNIFENADPSTVIHESAHYFLQFYIDMIKTGQGTERVQEQMNTLLEWWGINSVDEIGVDQHEMFARTFEAYVREGDAPTPELRSVFERFAAWLVRLYRSVTSIGETRLTEEVKDVFDRMLATDEQLNDQAMQQEGLFNSAEEAGMTPEAFADYEKALEASREAAAGVLRAETMEAITRQQTEEYKEARDRIMADVEDDLARQRNHQAKVLLSTGKLPDGTEMENWPGGKLNRAFLAEMFGDEPDAIWRQLPAGPKTGVVAKGGTVNPEIAAEMLGYKDVGQMIEELISTPNWDDAVRAETSARLQQEFGDVTTDTRKMEKAVQDARHNEEAAQAALIELRQLERQLGRGATTRAVLKNAARRIIGEKLTVQMKPEEFLRAERKAIQAAATAMGAKKVDQAAFWKRRQLLNHYLYMEARDAAKQIEKDVRYVKKFSRKGTRANLSGQFLQQIDKLLERFDFRKSVTNKAVEKRQSLREFIADAENAGLPISISPKLFDEALRKHYKELTVAEFRDVMEAIKHIEHLARMRHKLLAHKKEQDMRKVIDGIVESLHENNKTIYTGEQTGEGAKDKLIAQKRKANAWLAMKEMQFRELDGDKMGPLWEALWLPLSEAANQAAIKKAEASKYFGDLFAQYEFGERKRLGGIFGKKIQIPGVGTFTKEEMLAVALNSGNDTNWKRLVEGNGYSEQQLKTILDRLDQRDWDIVQSIWDYYDNVLWPQVKTLEERLDGIAPEKVEASPQYQPQGVTLRGGYYPIRYNSEATERTSELDETSSVQDIMNMRTGTARAATRKGHTEARLESVKGQELKLSLNVLSESINNVIQDLTHREVIIDAVRIIKDKDFTDAFKAVAGKERYRALMPWLREAAGAAWEPSTNMDKFFLWAKSRTSMVNIGFSISTALINGTGLFVSMDELGPSRVLRHATKFFSNPLAMKRTADFVTSRSDYMEGRHKAFERDVNEQLRKLKPGSLMPSMSTFYILITWVDKGVSIPTWMAAYDKHLEQNPNDEKGAVQYADHVVRTTQGSGRAIDLSAAASQGGTLMKLVTVFFSYFNMIGNRFARAGHQLTSRGPAGIPRFAASMLFLWFLPATLEQMIKGAFTDSGEDDEDERMARVARSLITYPTQTVPIFRDVFNSLYGALDPESPDFGYQFSPASDVVEAMIKTIPATVDVATGEATEADARQIVMGVSYGLGLPGRQIWRTTEHLMNVQNGESNFNPISAALGE